MQWKHFGNLISEQLAHTRSHCLKGIRIWSYSGPYFPTFGLNMETYFVSQYSVRMRENTDQNNSEYGHFFCSELPNPLSHTGQRLIKYQFNLLSATAVIFIERECLAPTGYIRTSNSFLSLTASWAFEKRSQKFYSDIAFDNSFSSMNAFCSFIYRFEDMKGWARSIPCLEYIHAYFP